MFKTIISKKKSFLFNFNHLSTFRDENKLFINSFKFFARKEINKNIYIADLQRFNSEKNESLSLIAKNKFEVQQDLKNNYDISPILKNFLSSVDSNRALNFENVEFKEFYLEILNCLRNENIEINALDNWLKMIEMKYSSIYQINNLPFKLLLLIDQILNNHSIEIYKNKYSNLFINTGFDHLIELYNENFYQLNDNSEDLLLNNFLFFMITNKGEISDLLKALSVKSQKFNINLEKLLSQTIKVKDESLDKKINYNYFLSYESHYKHAPSEITNDYSFKYRDINSKKTLYNNLIYQKQNIHKMKYLINSSNQLKNAIEVDLDEIERVLSTFLLREAKDILNEDIIKINNEINKFNKIIEELSCSLTHLKVVYYNKLTINNLENIFNPLFSGEKSIKKQYSRVASVLGSESAKKLFDLFLQQQTKHKSYTVKDLFCMNLIINNNNASITKNFFKISIGNNVDDYDFQASFNLEKKPFVLSKKEKIIFDEIKNSLNSILLFSSNFIPDEEKPKKIDRTKENSNFNSDLASKTNFKITQTDHKEESNNNESKNKLPITDKVKSNISNNEKNDFKAEKNILKTNLSKEKLSSNKQSDNKNEKKTISNKDENSKDTEKKFHFIKPQKTTSNKTEEIIKESKDVKNKDQQSFIFEKLDDFNNKEIENNFKPIVSEVKLNKIEDNEIKSNSNSLKSEQPTIETTINKSLKDEKLIAEPKITQEDKKKLKTEIQANLNENSVIIETEKINNASVKDIKENSEIKIEIKESLENVESKLPDNKNNHEIQKSNNEVSSSKKKEDFISMEEKFKKQKMKKFYFNDNRNYHSLISTTFRNFSSNVLQKDDLAQDNLNPIDKKNISLKKDKRIPNSDVKIKLADNYSENFNMRENIKTNNPQNIQSIYKKGEPKRDHNLNKFSKIETNKTLIENPSFKMEKKINDAEDDQSILRFLEKDEAIIENIDLNNNNEIVVEANYEMNDFSMNYWIDFYLKNKKEKNVAKCFETHLIQKLRIYKNDEKAISGLIESITSTSLKNILYPVDLNKILYNLFVESINLFEINLGHNGYYNLLLEVLSDENRRPFEKIILHMNKFNFIPNDTIYELILNICDKYNYPSLLKNYTDDIVLSKNFILSGRNFTKYIHILSMFKETEEYVINLVESSYSDFKLPIKSEFYEYLIFKSILQGEYKKVHSYLDSLNKRYLSDYPNEKARNIETYNGNLYLINSLIEIIVDIKQNYESPNNDYQGISLNDSEINKITIDLIQSCKVSNKSWYLDEKLIKFIYNFYSKINFNIEELKNLLDDLSKNPKIESSFGKELISGMFKNIFEKFLFFMKKNNELDVRKSLNMLTNLLRFNSSKLTPENKEAMYKEENIRKIISFLRENLSNENKEALKQFIKDSLEMKKTDYSFIDTELIRRLAYLVYDDSKLISNIFEESSHRFVNKRNLEN